jgi:hypothetical protein
MMPRGFQIQGVSGALASSFSSLLEPYNSSLGIHHSHFIRSNRGRYHNLPGDHISEAQGVVREFSGQIFGTRWSGRPAGVGCWRRLCRRPAVVCGVELPSTAPPMLTSITIVHARRNWMGPFRLEPSRWISRRTVAVPCEWIWSWIL